MSGNVTQFPPQPGGQPQRPMPHSIDAEQALLGACMLNAEAVDLAERFVKADDFFDPLHRRIWQAIVEAHGAGKSTSPVLLAALFGPEAVAELSPGFTLRAYLARLCAEATTVVGAPDYAAIIRDTADCRRIIVACETAAEQAYQGAGAVKIAEATIGTLDAVASAKLSAAAEQTTILEVVTHAVQRSEDAANGKRVKIEIPWGIHDLDTALGGLDRGDLTILGGRPGMGKTTLALATMIYRSHRDSGEYFVSLEMNGEQLGQRAASCIGYMKNKEYAPTYEDIRNGKLVGDQVEILRDAVRYVKEMPLIIEQEGALSMSQLANRARRVAEKFARKGKRLNVMTVDHLGLMKPSDRYKGNRVNEVGEFTAGLKALAKELETHIIALCQLSRGVEGRDDKRPTMGDFRDSGSIEQDADVLLACYRDAYYLSKLTHRTPEQEDELLRCQNEMQAIILKQRQGRTQTVNLFAVMGCNYVNNQQKGLF